MKSKTKSLKAKTDKKTKQVAPVDSAAVNVENTQPNKVGRPSDFKPEYVQEFLDYFNVKPHEEKEVEELVHGNLIRRKKEVTNDMPSLAGFAVKIGVHRDTLHQWANQKDDNDELIYPEFSDAYKRAKDFQENYLVTNGLASRINPQFAMFVAKNVIGWRDKQPDEADVIVNNVGKDLTDEQLDAQIDARLKKLKDGK